MKRIIIIYLSSIILASCVSTAPLNNEGFIEITSLSQLEGTYKNKGDGGPNKTVPLYLSRVLWPNDRTIEHESIETITVTLGTKKSLIVTATTKSEVVKSTLFTEGKDFKVNDGEITLTRELGIAGFKPGEPMLGLYMGESKIGLDKSGHGKFQSSGGAAGLVYMLLPIAIGGTEDIRFYRIE